MKTATASAENIAYDGIISLIMKGEVKPEIGRAHV